MWIWLPYHVDVPMERVPWANWALIAVTSLVSLAGMGSVWQFGDEGWLWAWCLDRSNFKIYQLLTHQFVHLGFLHLAGNMFFLFIFGNAINAKLGQWRYLLCYFGLGILSGLVWMASTSDGRLLGASGAICGITGMFLVLYPFNEVAVFYGWLFVAAGDIGVTYWSAIWIIGLYFLFDLIGAFVFYYEPIAYTAHLGGYVFGISLALILLLGRWIRPVEGEETLLQYLGLGEPIAKRKRKKKRSFVRKPTDVVQETPQAATRPVVPPEAHWGNWGD